MPDPHSGPDNGLRTFARHGLLRVMMRRVNRRRWPAATLAALLACVALAAAPAPAAPAVQPPGEPPDAAQIVEAYLRARQWVDHFSLPAMGAMESRLPLDNATGACVILRRGGRVVGVSTATLRDARHQELLIRFALGQALGQVLGDPAVASLPEALRPDVGRTLTLEIEVAGPLQPLLGRTLQRLSEQIEPGLDGLAFRHGEQVAMTFPSHLRATNSEGQTASRVPALALQLDLDLPASEINALLQRRDVTVSRFRTAHLAQAAPERLPFETFRGDRIVPESDIDAARIAAFADGVARHLLASIWPDPDDQPEGAPGDAPLGLMMGDYRPAADSYQPLVAPPLDQALAAFALARYGRTAGVNAETASAARRASERILESLAKDRAFALADMAACAALVYAIAEHVAEGDVRVGPEVRQLWNEAAQAVSASFEAGAFRVPGHRTNVPPHVQAMLAGAMMRSSLASSETIDPVRAAHVRRPIDAAWASVPESQHVELLPWIAWAELDYAVATDRPPANMDRLRSIRDMLEAVRFGVDAPPDMNGGFALAQPGEPVRADSQSSRPAAFLATLLGDERLTPDHVLADAAARQRLTMRFLIQLSARESLVWSMRNPARALGGVRHALWDHNLPRAAQSMALLAAAETLRSLTERTD